MIASKVARGVLAAFIFGSAFIAGAQLAIPPLTGHVADQTATLTREQQATLEEILQAFEARKGIQIAILIVLTSEPETIEQYALRVTEQWKVNRKRVDDGAILVIAKNDRVMRIEIGYGLKGALTYGTITRILSDTIVPRFKKGDFFGGIAAGVDRMISVIDGEPWRDRTKILPELRQINGDRGAPRQYWRWPVALVVKQVA